MKYTLIVMFLSAVTTLSIAGERQSWIETCQNSNSELSGTIGYRICTGKYLQRLEKQQNLLLKEVQVHVKSQTEKGIDATAAQQNILSSQKAWTVFTKRHCDAAQIVFGVGNASGDVEPSCLVALYEARNRQLRGMLDDNYER